MIPGVILMTNIKKFNTHLLSIHIMKRKLNSIFGLAVLAILFSINADSAFAQTNKLYMAMTDIGPSTKALMASKNIQNVPIISGKEINPAGEKTLDEASFTDRKSVV